MRILCTLPLVLTLACDGVDTAPDAVDTAPAATLPTEQAPAVLNESPEWSFLADFESNATLKTGVLYGRATARTIVPNGNRCSGFLIDDDILGTADHCGGSPGAVTTAIFGEFGPSDGDYSTGIEEARKRLEQLGVPSWVESGLSDATLTTFRCTWNNQDGNRDVAYWECLGNDISWTNAGASYTYRIKPGHLWGHYNIGRGNRPDGRDVYAVSVNRTCGDSSLNTLLSPGDIDDSTDSCIGSYGSCFDVTTDWVGGSSGGVIVDRTTHEAFGVVNGSTWWWFGDADDPCDRWDAAINTGSYIGPGADTFTNEDADGGGWSVGGWRGATSWAAGSGGTRKYRYCPSDTLAAGIVGSTSDDGRVGNLGLVCVPHNTPQRLRLDRATVISGGSIDVDFHSANRMDLNTYMHEVLSDTAPDLGVQTLAMCPAGMFITGVQAYGGSYLNKVSRLYCEDPQNGKQISVFIGGGIGTIGGSWAGTRYEPTCPDGAYFSGLWVNSGWVTDGFAGYCRDED